MNKCQLCYKESSVDHEEVNFHQINKPQAYKLPVALRDHWACRACADLWMQFGNTCPYCRDAIARFPHAQSSVQSSGTLEVLQQVEGIEPQRLSPWVLEAVLDDIRSGEQSFEYYRQVRPLIQHPEDLEAVRRAANAPNHRVPQSELTNALNSMRSNNFSFEQIRRIYPSIRHPYDLQELRRAEQF